MLLRKITIATTTIFAVFALASIWDHPATAQAGTPPDTLTYQGKPDTVTCQGKTVRVDWDRREDFTECFWVVKVKTGPAALRYALPRARPVHMKNFLMILLQTQEDQNVVPWMDLAFL